MVKKNVKGREKHAVAYFRTSSATNVGPDKDSVNRQRDSVRAYAKKQGLLVVQEFDDPAVSGADPIQDRPGFGQLLGYLAGNSSRIVLVENASRFARDLAVQIAGHDLLKARGIDLVPVDAPDHFTDETPTAVVVRQILGVVSEFEKISLVQKLRKARDRKRARTGRCEGRKPVPVEVVREAKRLRRKNPRTGRVLSLRKVSARLAEMGFVAPSGNPYGAESVRQMIAKTGTSRRV